MASFLSYRVLVLSFALPLACNTFTPQRGASSCGLHGGSHRRGCAPRGGLSRETLSSTHQRDANQARLDPLPLVDHSSHRYLMQFDGGSRGNPGAGGAGAVLWQCQDDAGGEEVRTVLWCGYFDIKSCTNNEAEYMGLIQGLKAAFFLGVEELYVEGDSMLVIKQLQGEYKVKSDTLMSFYEEARKLSGNFRELNLRHIDRESNGAADALANQAMDTASSRAQAFFPATGR